MPYYRWKGVNLQANNCKGMLFARSEDELDYLLFQKDIALLHCKPVNLVFVRPITTHHTLSFLEQFSSLVHAGVPIPKALRLVADRFEHKQCALMLQEIADAVADGVSLPEALQRFDRFFSPVIITTITTGLETGNLPATLDLLVEYLSARVQLRKKITSALFMPLITLGFFLTITAVLMVVLVPRFAHLLHTMQRELPPLTQTLLNISSFLSGIGGISLITGLLLIIWLFLMTLQSPIMKKIRDQLWVSLPYFHQLMYDSAAGSYFQSLSILVSGGMPLVPALSLAQQAINNRILQERFAIITRDVASGYQLSHALGAHAADLVAPGMIAIVALGEETGNLGPLFAKISQEYYEQLYRHITLLTTLLQPILLILLGGLILALIIAIYTPVFTMSYAV